MNRPEQAIQKAVFEHFTTRAEPHVFAFHTPLGGKRSKVEAAIMSGLGVVPGIPDVIAFKQAGGGIFGIAYVYALELKDASRRNRMPNEHERKQAACRARMAECGVTVGVAYSLDEALDLLERWGLLRGVRQ